MTIPRLRMHDVGKSFGATIALKSVSLEIAPGEVHALIGENGAGKSTLMKVLSGAYIPDRGVIEIDGRPFIPANPQHALRSGIAMIYQELNLAPHLSVEENILLGSEPDRLGWIDRRERRRLAEAALAKLDCQHIPLDPPLYRRSLAEKQMVEIARALVVSPRILIMDEPTSSLTQRDVEKLFAVIRKLREQGVSIIYISHFLEECQRLADRYTVLRDGETVSSGEMASAELPKIIRLMVGREIKDIYPRMAHAIGQPLLEFWGLAGVRKPTSVDLTLRAGEILGIAGLIGAGRTETLRVAFGLDRMTAGKVYIGGVETIKASPRERLQDGIGLLSENRKEEGLMLNRSLADNLTMTRLEPFCNLGIISNRRQRAETVRWMENLSVRAQSPAQSIGELSGGNQQKIAIGRLLHHQARILLLDEPTRGIDVASKAQIYQLVGKLAAAGKAIIFVSSYLPELLGVCDTIAVMCRGAITAVRPVQEWTEHGIIAAAIGQVTES